MKRITIVFLYVHTVLILHAQTKTENVVIITLDGLRWQEVYTGADEKLVVNKDYAKDPIGLKNTFWGESVKARRELLMPFFWKVIAEKGQLYGNRQHGNKVNCTNKLLFSYPGYSEILCGFADDARIRTNNKIDNPNSTVLEFLNKHPSFKGKVAAFGSWDVFPYIINESRSGIPVNAGFESATTKPLSDRELFLNELQTQIPSPWPNVRLDAFTFHYALEYLKKKRPRVLLVSFGETDDFAHDGRYDAYLHAARQNDDYIRLLWEWVQADPKYKDKTTFLITTDHGRGTVPLDSWRNHGSETKGSDEIWIAVIGPDTEGKGELVQAAQYYQNQLASTLAAFLDIGYTNEKKVGEVITPMIRK